MAVQTGIRKFYLGRLVHAGRVLGKLAGKTLYIRLGVAAKLRFACPIGFDVDVIGSVIGAGPFDSLSGVALVLSFQVNRAAAGVHVRRGLALQVEQTRPSDFFIPLLIGIEDRCSAFDHPDVVQPHESSCEKH